MTEKKKLPEQIALHTYRRPVEAQARDPYKAGNRSVVYQDRRYVQKREVSQNHQRVVTVPDADPSRAWNTFSARQKELRQARTRPQKYVKMAQRTYAQTGMWASSGRMKAVRHANVGRLSSPIPARSGRLVRKRGFLFKLFSLLFAGILCVLAVNFVLTNNTFRIEQVTVTGAHNAALAHTIQQMGMRGQNIFLINVSAVTEQVAALPLVDTVSVSKQLPNQLVISINERTPVLLWQTSQGQYSIDKHGVVIATASNTPGATTLQTVTALGAQGQAANQPASSANLQPGTHLDPAEITFASAVFERLPKVLGPITFKLYYDGTIYASNHEMGGAGSRGSYIVESPDGWKAYLGDVTDANPLDNRLVELQQILALAQKQHLTLATIDLRYGLRPVYTLK